MTSPEAIPQSAVIHFAGRAGDHNDLAMAGSPAIAHELASRLGVASFRIGTPEPALNTDWRTELDAARTSLTDLRSHVEKVLSAGTVPVTALSRCTAALATVPMIARYRPDAVVVWFDAHADLNTPETTTTGYLGGLALASPLGLWDSGLGAGLAPSQTVLVGTRDIDPPEQELIDRGMVSLVAPGRGFVERLRLTVAGRPVYVHIDCDVLEPDTVPTDYHVPSGLTTDMLHDAAQTLSSCDIVGVQIAEFEADSTPEQTHAAARKLIDALQPLLEVTR